MLLTISLTAGAVVFGGLVLMMIFRNLPPAIVAVDYRNCLGKWAESYLNGCETGLHKIPQQPVNTYTNLAYLAAGVFLAHWIGGAPAFVFFGTLIYLYIGSALYHATSTHWAGMLDVTGIYAVFSALAVFAAAVLLGAGGAWMPFIMFTVAGLAAYFLSKHFRRDMHLKIGIFLGVAYACVLLQMGLRRGWSEWPVLLASFLVFAVAFIIWKMDLAKSFPLRRWGHGFWHVLTAVASALLFYTIHQTQ